MVPQGHIFCYPGPPHALQVPALLSWDCKSVATDAAHLDSHNWVWVYLDGSLDRPWSGSAAIIVWPNGNTLVLAIPCPYHSSKYAEFWAFIQMTRYLQDVSTNGTVFFCVDSSQVGHCVDSFMSGATLPSCSNFTQGTWNVAVSDLLEDVSFHLGIGWLKDHVGFAGNKTADALAEYTSYALRVQHCHRQPPSLHSITFGGNQVIHKMGGSERKDLYPRYQRTGIHIKTSFDWSSSYPYFSALESIGHGR